MHAVPGYPLWTGHAGDVRGLYERNDAGFEAVVDLASNELPPPIHRDLTYLRIPLIDGAGNAPWQLAAAIGCVERLLNERVPTLVACSAGLSRSLAITAGALALARGESLHDSLLRVAGGHGDVAPSLLAEIEVSLQRI